MRWWQSTQGRESTPHPTPTPRLPESELERPLLGTHSEVGELAVARLLTITRTCQARQLNMLLYLTAAIAAGVTTRHLTLRKRSTP